jgi:hypothetical protein
MPQNTLLPPLILRLPKHPPNLHSLVRTSRHQPRLIRTHHRIRYSSMAQIERLRHGGQLIGSRVHAVYEYARRAGGTVPRDGVPGVAVCCEEFGRVVRPVEGGYLALRWEDGDLRRCSGGVDTDEAVLAASTGCEEVRLPWTPCECLYAPD